MLEIIIKRQKFRDDWLSFQILKENFLLCDDEGTFYMYYVL